MPITSRMDDAQRVIFATAVGRVTNGDVLAYAKAVATDPANGPDVRELFDARGVTAMAATAEGIVDVACTVQVVDRTRKPSKLAAVAVSAVVFGRARMYQTLRSGAPRDIQVFDDLGVALAWLGPTEAPSGQDALSS